MLDQVASYLESLGMWIPENKPKYDFRLSPEVFVVYEHQIQQLETFAGKLRKYFETKTGKFPAFCKIDLMVNADGDLKIAEIDGLNKRAFGYAILERKIAQMFGHDTSRFFPGIENSLRQAVGSKKLFVVVPGREKYYKYGFNILIEALCGLGVGAQWGHEKDALRFLSGENPDSVVLLDIPKTGHEKLDGLLASKNWEALIPNEQFFSSKANLVGLEDSLVPQTLQFCSVADIPFEYYVIKHVGRSGCKGVYFSDEAMEVDSNEYIVQEFVPGKEFEFSYFDGTALVKSGGWQVRLIVTLDLDRFKVVDVDVTARQDRLVHGASDSIQIAGVKK